MLNMNWKLEQREKEGKIIKVGIVGAGQMGRGMVTQMVLMKGMTPAIVSDINVDLAVKKQTLVSQPASMLLAVMHLSYPLQKALTLSSTAQEFLM